MNRKWECDCCGREYIEDADEEVLSEWVCLEEIDEPGFFGICTGTMHLVRGGDFDPYEAAGESPFGLPGGGHSL
jgi:hypothetical protein